MVQNFFQNFSYYAILISGLLFIGILVCIEIGWRLGGKYIRRNGEDNLDGVGTVEGALFALLGLLIAFTFSGAASRFDTRRLQIAEEANAIGTAYLRLDLLPKAAQPELRSYFRNYLDARLGLFKHAGDNKLRAGFLADTARLQKLIWTRAVETAGNQGPAPILILPALNAMFDITTTRTMAALVHPPVLIFVLLIVISLACSVMAGYGFTRGKGRRWSHILGFALILTLTFYVILDLEFPRFGYIRIDAYDHVLADVRRAMDRP